MDNEAYINQFLSEFFSYNYHRRPLLFDNIPNIYSLMKFIYNNTEFIDDNEIDFNDVSSTTLIEAEKLIDSFYESIGVDFKLNDVIRDGTFDILKKNAKKSSHKELMSGFTSYVGNHKSIEVYNNGLITDTIIWVHEISHYRNQTPNKRNDINDLLTELLAFTEELIYVDYLESLGYKKEANMYRIEEYNNLLYFIKVGLPFVKIYHLYFQMGNINKEDYKYLYKNEENYNKDLEHFMKIIKKDQDAIYIILHYAVAIISIYNYQRYKEDQIYLYTLEKLNSKIKEDIALEEALKIMNIKPDFKSLKNIVEKINIYKSNLITKRTKSL